MRSNGQFARPVAANRHACLSERKQFMPRSLLAAAIALLFAGSLHAAGEPAAKPGKRGSTPVAPAPATAPTAAEREADLMGRTVFQVILGELALQRGQTDVAVTSYADLARRTQDPKVVARATEIALFARQFELALDLARQWTQLEPENQRARQTLSTTLVLLNRIDELAPEISTLLEQDKANLGENLLRLNRMLARHGDKQAVQRLVDRVAMPYAGIAEAHFAMATAAANAGDAMRALAEADKALDLRPDWEMAALVKTQLVARQSLPNAIDFLTGFVDRVPAAKDARLALARLLIAEKRYDESRKHFDRLLRDYPENPDVIYPVAMLALQQGDTATGKTQLEKLLKGDFADKSTVHFFLGQIEEELKNRDAALAHYMEVSAGEQFIAARARAAQLLVQKGRHDEARRLLQGTPGHSEAEKTQLILAESQLLRETQRFGEAYALLENALKKQPDNTDLLYDAALLAERLGKPELLESHLKHLLALKPDHAHGLNALGYSLADRNIRLPEAYELLSKAVALAPNDPFIMDSLGWVLFRQGKLDDALQTLQRAYSLKADPEIAAHLGEVLWTLNRKEEARQVLQNAARQHPDNEVLAGALKKLLP